MTPETSMAIPRYSMVIAWSPEDDAFLVRLPEWEHVLLGYAGHGDTYAEAAEAGHITIEQLVSIALEQGTPLPPPLFADLRT